MDRREHTGLAWNRQRVGVWRKVRNYAYFSILAGLFCILAGLTLSIFNVPFPSNDPLYDSWSLFCIFAVYITVAAFALRAARQQLKQGNPQIVRPNPANEKQLLMALRDSGRLTAVEASLETSLTVDEAEEILSRHVDRSHLIVQSHEGALFYTLPGRRPDALGEKPAPHF